MQVLLSFCALLYGNFHLSYMLCNLATSSEHCSLSMGSWMGGAESEDQSVARVFLLNWCTISYHQPQWHGHVGLSGSHGHVWTMREPWL
jgi:hypothetical protein